MSDVIRLLPDSVANQIAAGEVIQRPASVIKELVENSVDAGATHIQIILKDAGRTLIQVVDNGCGMSDTDARLAFERHATSKISQAADLFALNTMGFRGEALASIAAIAQVDLRTMRRGESVGSRLIINGSKVESQEPEACQPGSNMMVKNLFFNVPARRKFLKKDSVELSNILREFERLALVNPELEFTLVHNDSVLHQLLRGSLKQRIGDLFGKSLEKQIIPVETETSIVKVTGFVGLPECARKRNALQYFFVNGRNMRHPYFHKAVMQCYEQLIPSDEQPNYFLNFEVAPDSIDVNIHPTKNEIKFENEQSIWQILVAAIKESLGKFNAVPSINFDAEDMPDIPAFTPDANAQHGIELDLSYNPFASTPVSSTPKSSGGGTPSSWRRETNAVTGDWEKLYANFTGKRDDSIENIRASAINEIDAIVDIPEEEVIVQSKLDIESDEVVQNLMQIKNRYIWMELKR
jgi:DNA mismatch repair protein MutL